MTTIHLARHAQSLFNIGQSTKPDCSLSEQGKKDAKTLLQGEYDIVICSNLRRSQETLNHSSVKYGKMIVSPLCREMKNASCDFLEDEKQVQETEEEVHKRIKEFQRFLKLLVSTHTPKKVLIISHSTFIHRMTGQFLRNCQKLEHKLV